MKGQTKEQFITLTRSLLEKERTVEIEETRYGIGLVKLLFSVKLNYFFLSISIIMCFGCLSRRFF